MNKILSIAQDSKKEDKKQEYFYNNYQLFVI